MSTLAVSVEEAQGAAAAIPIAIQASDLWSQVVHLDSSLLSAISYHGSLLKQASLLEQTTEFDDAVPILDRCVDNLREVYHTYNNTESFISYADALYRKAVFTATLRGPSKAEKDFGEFETLVSAHPKTGVFH